VQDSSELAERMKDRNFDVRVIEIDSSELWQ
jgi:hypothetical protein